MARKSGSRPEAVYYIVLLLFFDSYTHRICGRLPNRYAFYFILFSASGKRKPEYPSAFRRVEETALSMIKSPVYMHIYKAGQSVLKRSNHAKVLKETLYKAIEKKI